MSVDWEGQNPPTPTPVIAATTNPCHASWTNGYSGIADREDAERDPEQPAATQAVDEDAEDRAGDDADERVRADDQADDAEADPAHVVQVDEQERQRDAVPERVDEPADLERRDGSGQRRKVGAKDAAQPWDTSRVCARAFSSTRTSST